MKIVIIVTVDGKYIGALSRSKERYDAIMSLEGDPLDALIRHTFHLWETDYETHILEV